MVFEIALHLSLPFVWMAAMILTAALASKLRANIPTGLERSTLRA